MSIYGTEVVEADAADLASFEQHMRTFASRPELRDLVSGHLDLVDGGRREFHRVI